MKLIFFVILFVLFLYGMYGVYKPYPHGVNMLGAVYSVPAKSLVFLEDRTYVDESGVRHSDQEIFDFVLSMIEGAEHYILIDMFLFNDFLGTATTSHRSLSGELTTALLEKKTQKPGIQIVFITDPINEIYGGHVSEHLEALRGAGVNVYVTDLSELRDSNPLYSALWRAFFERVGNSTKEGMLPNPFDPDAQKLSLRTYLSLFNFKANHRKVVVADTRKQGDVKLATLVTSANPHDGSSAHTNTAIVVFDKIWEDILETEQGVVDFSGGGDIYPDKKLLASLTNETGQVKVQMLTEEWIRDKTVEMLENLKEGDTLDMAMFYLSDRKVVLALKDAAKRGVQMRILLDPNKDAFGREKNGIPNRPVAKELVKGSGGNIKVRWCDTHGEQCHTKLLIARSADKVMLLQGSANLTRRNIGGYNLETDIYVESGVAIDAAKEAGLFFNDMWNNDQDRVYSAPYEKYKDDSLYKTALYRLTEKLGISSF